MTWFMLNDGWRDESTEGPYTETLQTFGGLTTLRLYRPYCRHGFYELSHCSGFKKKFRTVQNAKRFVAKLAEKRSVKDEEGDE